MPKSKSMDQMSQEEMIAAAKEQCIFCHIASGKVAAKKVYEDDKIIAVLDINPANPGHILVITKEHYMVMPQIPEDVIKHIGMIAKQLSHAVLRALKAQGTTIFVANGAAAGQRAQHFMLHVIPRMEKDGIGIDIPQYTINESDFKKIHKLMKQGVAKTLGIVEGLEEETEKEEKMIEKAEEKQKEEDEEEQEKTEAKSKKEKPDEETEEEQEKAEEKTGKGETEEEEEEKPKKKKKAEEKQKEEETEEEPKKKPVEKKKERQNLDDIADFLTG